jgi:hypothetical protein
VELMSTTTEDDVEKMPPPMGEVLAGQSTTT